MAARVAAEKLKQTGQRMKKNRSIVARGVIFRTTLIRRSIELLRGPNAGNETKATTAVDVIFFRDDITLHAP